MGDSKPVVTYDYDLPFQRRLLAAASEDAKWLTANKETLQPDFFTDELLVGVAAGIRGYVSENDGKLPDLPGLLEGLKDHVAPGRKWQEYADEARRVWKCRGINSEYYRKQAAAFARRQAVARAVEESSKFLELGEYDQIERLVQEALRVGSAGTGGYDFFAHAKERVDNYLTDASAVRAGAVPTGFGPLDRRTKGGLKSGEVGCVLGLAGHGKSSTLVSFAGNCLMSGRKVLHVSLENSLEVTAEKYDTFLFGKPIESIRKLPKTFRKTLLDLRERLKASLEIQVFPADSLPVAEFGSVVAASTKPDVVILDYGTLLKSGSKREDKRHELTDIWKGIRKVAGECGVPIWSAHQANRVGVQSALLGMEHSAEFFDIVGIVDVMASVNWDEERPSEATLYVFKNRLGKTGFQIPCSVDWSLSKIRPLSDE